MRVFIAGLLFAALITAVVILAQMYSLSVIIDAAFLQEWNAPHYGHYVIILMGAVAVRAVMAWTDKWLGMKMSIHQKARYRKKLLKKIHEIGPVRLKGEKTGELIGLQLNGIEKLDDFYSLYIPAAIRMGTIPLIIFGVVVWLDWPSGLVFMITGPLIPIFMYLIGTKAGDKIREQWGTFRRMNAHFLDTIQGMDTLKLFGREKSAGRSINNVSRMFRVTTMRVLKIAFLSGMILELAASVSTAVVAVEIGVRLIEGMVGFQIGLFVLLLAPEFYLPFRTFGSAHHAGMEGAEAGARLFELFDHSDTELQDRKNYLEKVPEHPTMIEIKNLNFRYPGSGNHVLNGVNLTLQANEVHTLAGASGEGKTTLMNILSTLIPYDDGEIMVNGNSLAQMDAKRWKSQISYLSQFSHFFPGSIEDNIRLGSRNATEDQILEASRLAQAHAFISELPNGYQTVLGEDGLNLSGGERQRIALARTFLKKSPVYFLDEPGSSLNEELEAALMRSIKRLAKNSIVFILSHQQQTMMASDRISILKEGVITESGPASEVIAARDTEVHVQGVL